MSADRASGLVLASRSPRRQEALTALGYPFLIFVSEVERRLGQLDDPTDPVPIAAAKAIDGAEGHPHATVLAGDTIVVLQETLLVRSSHLPDGVAAKAPSTLPGTRNAHLGKPADRTEARDMLRRLRGRRHIVRSALAISSAAGQVTAEVASPVEMRAFTDAELEAYVAGDEPLDCAGAYDVHRQGGSLVADVAGCYSAVVGLPVVAAAVLLGDAGLAAPHDPVRTCSHLYGRPCLAERGETASLCTPTRLTHLPPLSCT